MPELPEVETVRRGLQRLIVGKRIARVVHDTDKSFPNAPADVKQFVIGARIIKVARRAKVLLIELDSKYTLLVHLKMTGQLVYVGSKKLTGDSKPSETINAAPVERFGAGHPSKSLIGELPDKSTRATLTFNDGSHLYFNDQRKFGWMKLIPTAEVPNIDFMKKLGPEPLAAGFTATDFRSRIRRRSKSAIKAVLLDQSVVAGVGNIYADESLWGAKIHPARRVENIGDKQLNTLFEQLQYVLNLSIEKGGSTDRNYVNAEGKKGSYLSFARVFRRQDHPCPRCGTTIIKTRVAGRGTHLCPHCQVV
jgi:formamidopyrimidine-DNA glycosylase